MRYENGANYLQVAPSQYGRATIHDRDVLISCISQCMHALNSGKKISRRMRFRAGDLLIATNRQTSGRGYELLKNAFRLLQGTQIKTNIRREGEEQFKVFGLIEAANVIRETRDGRMVEVEIVLSDWIFDAIEDHHVLTLSRQYFRLRRPLERRLCEIARKHCGHQRSWRIGVEGLRVKCGSESSLREFRRLLRSVVERDTKEDYMPDYAFSLEGETLGGPQQGMVGTRCRCHGADGRRAAEPIRARRGTTPRTGLGHLCSRAGVAGLGPREEDRGTASRAAFRELLSGPRTLHALNGRLLPAPLGRCPPKPLAPGRGRFVWPLRRCCREPSGLAAFSRPWARPGHKFLTSAVQGARRIASMLACWHSRWGWRSPGLQGCLHVQIGSRARCGGSLSAASSPCRWGMEG